jgi:hypothetical protein
MKKQFNTKLQSRSALLAAALALLMANGCNSNASNSQSADSTAKGADEIVPPTNPDGFSGAIGNVVKFSDHEVEINADDKPVFIKLTDSLRIYAPSPSSMANIKNAGYVGVISRKQPDQSEDQAAQVLILPEELRGLNEGSFMLPPEKGAESGGRMTNGSASDAGSGSRMSNGSVSSADTTSLTLQFQGHSRTVSVPAGTPVVEYKVSTKIPNPGDKIFLLVKKGADDSLVSSKIVCF